MSTPLGTIGLCNTSYKLVTKFIVNRLKPHLQHIIGPSKTSFICNRRSSDNAIIFQEFISHFKKINGQKSNMILKTHLEKNFDKLKWSLIRETLTIFMFPTRLVNLIMSCITSSSISILINRDKTTLFKPLQRDQIRRSRIPLPFHPMHGKTIQSH